MKKLFGTMMISALLFTMVGNSFAMAAVVEQPSQPMYIVVQQIKPKISIPERGTLVCTDTVRVLSGYSVDATWELQLNDNGKWVTQHTCCLLYTSPSPRDRG